MGCSTRFERFTFAATIALAASLSSSTAWGQDAREEPGPDAKASAKAHFLLGDRYFQESQWDRAIAEYRWAYALFPSPALLFDIARACEQKGDKSAALDHYRQYLVTRPNGAARTEAAEHIAALQRELDREGSQSQASRAQTSGVASEMPAIDASAARSTEEPHKPPTQSTGEPIESGTSARAEKRSLVAPVLVGAGVLVAASGGALLVWSRADYRSIRDSGCAPSCPDDSVSGPRTRESVGVVLVAIGGAAVAAGLGVWLFGSRATAPAARASTAAVLVPFGLGAAVRARF